MLSQLKWFLDEEESATPTTPMSSINAYTANAIADRTSEPQLAKVYANSEGDTIPKEQPSWMQMPAMVSEPLIIDKPIVESRLRKVNKLQVQTAASAFPSAQTVLGLTHKKDSSATMR
jgi:hypothetical protein